MHFALPLIFLMFSGLAAAQPSILVVGDSLSAAFGIDSEQSWTRLLQQRLMATAHPHQVINSSISGDTTQGGLARLPGALQRYEPTIAIIELGANDGLRGVSLNQMRSNLIEMITLCQKQGAEVLLLGMRLPPNYGPAYTDRFHATYQEAATQTGARLVPFLLESIADRWELMQADGLHPNAQAQPKMLDNVWQHLLPLLKQPL